MLYFEVGSIGEGVGNRFVLNLMMLSRGRKEVISPSSELIEYLASLVAVSDFITW